MQAQIYNQVKKSKVSIFGRIYKISTLNRFLVTVLLTCLAFVKANADGPFLSSSVEKSANNTGTAATSTLSDFDSVNLFNGNLMPVFPL